MNLARLLVLLVSLPLLLGGCGENNIKPKLEFREGIGYLKESNQPYTGIQTGWYRNGRKKFEIHFKNGKEHGPAIGWYANGQKRYEGTHNNGKGVGMNTAWHENGQKMVEEIYKDGNKIKGSEKFWNSKGQSVDSIEEAEAE